MKVIYSVVSVCFDFRLLLETSNVSLANILGRIPDYRQKKKYIFSSNLFL